MRPDHFPHVQAPAPRREPGRHALDASSLQPLAGAFSINTSPVVAPVAGGPRRWDRWAEWEDPEFVAAESGTAMKDGVRVRTGVPTGEMDREGRRLGVESLARSNRGKRALAEMPRWRRWLAGLLLWVAAGVGRAARFVGGQRKAKTAAGTEVVELHQMDPSKNQGGPRILQGRGWP